jgi:hypothetical protein
MIAAILVTPQDSFARGALVLAIGEVVESDDLGPGFMTIVSLSERPWRSTWINPAACMRPRW